MVTIMNYLDYCIEANNSVKDAMKKLDKIIDASAGRRDDLNNPVGSTMTSSVIQLVTVADDGNIRFDIVSIVFV